MGKRRTIYGNNLILRIIVAVFGTIGITGVLYAAADYYANQGTIIIMSVFWTIVFSLLFYYDGRYKLYAIVASIVVPVIYCVFNFARIIIAFRCYIDAFCSRAGMNPVLGGEDLKYEWAEVQSYLNSAFVIMTLVVALLTAMVVFRFTSMAASLVITLPVLGFVIGCGIVPDLFTIMICMLFVFNCMVLGRQKKSQDKDYTMIYVSLVIAIFTVIIYPECNYKRNAFFDDARTMISDVVYERFGINLDGRKEVVEEEEDNRINAAVGMGNGQIGQVDELYYDDNVVGTYTTVGTGTLQYIKIYQGKEFSDNNWARYIDTRESVYGYEYETSEILFGLTQADRYSISEEDSELVNRLYYIHPSFRNTSDIASSYNKSVAIIKDGSYKDYENLGLLMTKVADRSEADSYKTFVYGSYLSVSAVDRSAIETIFGQRKYYKVEDKIRYINRVEEHLRKYYKYTMKPGKVPEGKSAVQYFLLESRQGYCTYFATTAAIALRCAGIPTRYCAGYVINTTDSNGEVVTYEVKDSSAHAWLEVFLDDYGWVVVDPTPGYSDSDMQEVSSQADTDEQSSEVQSEAQTEEESIEQNITSPEDETDSTEESTDVPDNNRRGLFRDKLNAFNFNMRIVIAIIAVVIVVVLIILIIIRIVRRILLLKSQNTDEKHIMELYSYLEKLLALAGYERTPDCDYEDYIHTLQSSDAAFADMGLEHTMSVILKVRFGNAKYIDKADLAGIINTIRKVQRYAFSKARGLRKLIVCLI